ncbi:hypothetical protein WJ968_07585 [Achromobacter xylosoxidans]
MNSSITGYSDKISVAGGETIAFKVSARPARPYEARLVRIIHGDMNPAGPGYKEAHVPSSIEGAMMDGSSGSTAAPGPVSTATVTSRGCVR